MQERGVRSVFVEVDHITDAEVERVRQELSLLQEAETSVSNALAKALEFAVQLAPRANPSDIWQHAARRCCSRRSAA